METKRHSSPECPYGFQWDEEERATDRWQEMNHNHNHNTNTNRRGSGSRNSQFELAVSTGGQYLTITAS